MALLPELIVAKARTSLPEPFAFLILALVLAAFAYAVKNGRDQRIGTNIDNGRGLPVNRKALSGVPLALTFRGVTLRGIILDNDLGAWALEHLPSSLDAQKHSFHSTHSKISYLFARFGDESLEEEVRKMSRLQRSREGDITISVVDQFGPKGIESYVEFRIWGVTDLLNSFESEMLVGRLDYASMLAYQGIKRGPLTGPFHELTITYDK